MLITNIESLLSNQFHKHLMFYANANENIVLSSTLVCSHSTENFQVHININNSQDLQHDLSLLFSLIRKRYRVLYECIDNEHGYIYRYTHNIYT